MSKLHRIIYLVGPMGVGKSTIGRMLANELRIPFADTDQEIEARCGADVSWIYHVEGDEGFRRRETVVLKDLSNNGEKVIATGGGTILEEGNCDIITSNGFVVFLDADIDALILRMDKDKTRPLLQKPNRAQVIRDLYLERGPIYRRVSNITISTSQGNPMQIVYKIIDALNYYLKD